MVPYNPQEIEKKWQKKWLDEKVFKAKDDSAKPKYYQLETFPYPSGAGLHVGHPKGYIAEDVHARYTRMRGREVLYTMGWDAFGLPTENYAMKVNKSPQQVTIENTDHFREQVRMFGFSYDWDREINTSTPEYYKWTQWLFIQLFKKGLAYRAKAKVNWCPKDQTIIANEQVINGLCDRCGSVIEERFMEQWMLRITDYAERLLDGLKGLDWPSATVKRQEDWIGKSEGAEIGFPLKGPASEIAPAITIFTTRPDTLFGATYLVLAPEHSLVSGGIKREAIQNADEVAAYIAEASHKTDLMRQETAKEKTGVELKGVRAINPATKEEIPVWVADYVLGSYGTGAIMAVPAHDERDFAFANKFGLEIRQVVAPHLVNPDTPPRSDKENTKRDIIYAFVKHPTDNKFIALRSKKLPWLTPVTGGIEEGETPEDAGLREIKEETGYVNARLVRKMPFAIFAEFYVAHKDVNRAATSYALYFELADLDREPVAEEEESLHDVEWIEEKELDTLHPLVERPYILEWLRHGDYPFTGTGIVMNSAQFSGMDSETAKRGIVEFVGGARKTRYKLRDWSVSRQRYWGAPIPMVHCEKCGIVPVPDAELPVLLPVIENYRPQGVPPLASDPDFINVKCPRCGDASAKRDPETFDTFVDSSWYYLRYPDPHNAAAIFDKAKTKHWMPVDLYIIGAEHTVLHLLYSRFITKFLHDEGWLDFDEPFLKLRHQGLIRGADGQKMSKSKGNVVNPDELIAEFGADTVRLYEMFMGPFEDGAPWDPKGILGAERFLKRLWKYVMASIESTASGKTGTDDAERSAVPAIHRAVKKVGEDIEALKFNTAISALMILLNELESAAPLPNGELAMLIKVIHPFAPHMAQELWSRMGAATYLDFEPWPEFDARIIIEETVTLVFQVNGKVRDSATVASAITEDAAKAMAMENEKVKSALNGQIPKRVIYIEKKLVNIVV